MCTIAFDLLVGGDGAEDNFGELAAFEGAVGDTSGADVTFSATDLDGLGGRTLIPLKDASQSPY